MIRIDENINKFRFLVPPALAIIFALGDETASTRNFVAQSSVSLGGFGALFAGSLLLLTLGFVISSIGHAIVKARNWDTMELDNIEPLKKMFPPWNSSVKGLDFSRKDEKNQAANAIATWWLLKDEKMAYIREQVDTRWGMAMANMNCFLGVLFAPFLAIIISRQATFSNIWWVSWTLLLIVFCYLADRTYTSVNKISNLLVELYPYKKPINGPPEE